MPGVVVVSDGFLVTSGEQEIEVVETEEMSLGVVETPTGVVVATETTVQVIETLVTNTVLTPAPPQVITVAANAPTEDLLVLAAESGDGDFVYRGSAPIGTATSAAGWTIKKFDLDILGSEAPAPLESGPNAIWDNRENEVYS